MLEHPYDTREVPAFPQEDPRHGTVAGYNRIPCRAQCCRDAYARWRRGRDYDADHGRPRIISSIGSKRRIQALQALGWSQSRIGKEAGCSQREISYFLVRDSITAGKAAEIAALYDRLSMRLPPERNAREQQSVRRARNAARANGWAPPLAWDDEKIDDPDASPHIGRSRSRLHDDEIDETLIHRVLLDGRPAKPNPAERAELLRRWDALGRSRNELNRLIGGNIWRDVRKAS